MNSLFQQLNPQQASPTTKSSPQISDFFDNNGNFNLQKVLNQNPMLQTLLSLKNPNQSYKDLFYSLAQQKGINPQDIINTLAGNH